jgi:hypothetical protein
MNLQALRLHLTEACSILKWEVHCFQTIHRMSAYIQSQNITVGMKILLDYSLLLSLNMYRSSLISVFISQPSCFSAVAQKLACYVSKPARLLNTSYGL